MIKIKELFKTQNITSPDVELNNILYTPDSPSENTANQIFAYILQNGDFEDILEIIQDANRINHLDTIDLPKNSQFCKKQFSILFKSLKDNHYAKAIKSISIDSFKHIPNKLFIDILHNFTNLYKLHLPSNNIQDETLWSLKIKLQILEELNISFNSLSNSGAYCITKLCPSLKKLNISCNNITTQGAQIIANKLTDLEELQISFNNLFDQGVLALLENLPNLKVLNIAATNLSNYGALNILPYLSKLEALHMGFNDLDDHVINLVQESLHPNCFFCC
jgi:hypothetical protein